MNRFVSLVVAFFTVSMTLMAHEEKGGDCGPEWMAYCHLIGRFGDHRTGGGIKGLVPLVQRSNHLLFTQYRLFRLKQETIGGIGLAWRSRPEGLFSEKKPMKSMDTDEPWIRKDRAMNWAWGINAFVDTARTTSHNQYVRGTIGGEWLTSALEARVNGYFPNTSQHEVIIKDKKRIEQAFRGFDAEIGMRHRFCFGRLRGVIGTFSFHAPHARSYRGLRIRGSYELEDPFGWRGGRLFTTFQWHQAHKRSNETMWMAGIRIPLSRHRTKKEAPSLCRQMGELVWREAGMIVHPSRHPK